MDELTGQKLGACGEMEPTDGPSSAGTLAESQASADGLAPKGRRAIRFAAVVTLLALLVLPLWSVEYLPLTDYPNHLLIGFILKNFTSPGFNYSQHFTFEFLPLPYLTCYGLLWLLMHVFGPFTAGRILLTGYVLLLPLSIRYFLKSLGIRSSIPWLLSLLFVYNWSFNMGYVSFCLSFPIYFFGIGFWLRTRGNLSNHEKVAFGGVALLIYFSHLFTYCVFLWSLAVLSLLSPNRRTAVSRTAVAVLPSFVLFLWYVHMVLVSTPAAGLRMRYLSGLGVLIKRFVTDTVYSFDKREVLLLTGPLAVAAALLLAGVLARRKELFSVHTIVKGTENPRVLVTYLVISMLFLVLVTPFEMPGLWPINTRFAIFIFLLALGLLKLPASPKLNRALTAFVFVAAAMCSALMYVSITRYGVAMGELVSGVSVIKPNSKILPIIVDKGMKGTHTAPFSDGHCYYYIQRGGIGPFFYAYPYLLGKNGLLRYREKLETAGFWDIDRDWVRRKLPALDYDYVLLWGKDAQLAENLAAQRPLLWQQGRLRVFGKSREAPRGARW